MLPEPFGYVPFPGEFYRPDQLSAEVKNDPFVTRVYSADQMRQAVLEAEQRVPEGFVLVPVEPDGNQWSAGRKVFIKFANLYEDAKTAEGASVWADVAGSDIYRAMLASRPTPEKASKT
jgi:hypothetical protein